MSERLVISNQDETSIVLTIEPWAEEYQLEPQQTLSLTGTHTTSARGAFEVACVRGGLVVYSWPGSTLTVHSNGVDITRPSLQVPAPS